MLLSEDSFGYAMNQQGIGIGVNERGQSLVDAVYRALGYHRITEGGGWFNPVARSGQLAV